MHTFHEISFGMLHGYLLMLFLQTLKTTVSSVLREVSYLNGYMAKLKGNKAPGLKYEKSGEWPFRRKMVCTSKEP